MKIGHLQLETAHLSDLKTFYRDTFACPITNTTSEAFTVEIGTTSITFTEVNNGTDPFYHFAINIPQNQFNDAVAWVDDRVELLANPETGNREIFFENINSHTIYCLDPADNIVELIARHELSNDTERPFDSENFCEISEIGLPVLDKKRSVRALTENLDVSLRDDYDTSMIANEERITPIGDAHGQFIVVKQGREWFPTGNQPAEVYPITAKITGSSGEYTFPELPYQIFTQ